MCREAKMLLAISALFTFAMGLSGIFINVFFWKQTNDFMIIVLYNLMHYIVTPITFVLGGMIAKKKNGIWPLRLGLLIYAIFYTMILFIGNRGTLHIYILGIVFGVATGFYWLAYNTLSFDFTDVNNRDTFNGFNGSCSGIAAAAAPITSGYIISRFTGTWGYKLVFAATLGFFILLIIISIFLKCRNYGDKLDYRRAFSRNCKDWGTIRISTALWGFRDVIIVFLINILVIQTTKSELSLGELALMASLISSGAFMLVQKVIKPPRRIISIFIGTIGLFIAVLGLALKVSYATILIYVIIDAVSLPFFSIQLSSATFNVINRAHEENLRVEYMINKDVVLNGGRIISAVILIILLAIFNGASILRVYLIFIGLIPILSGFYLSKLKAVLAGGKDGR